MTAIREHNIRLTSKIAENALERGLRVNTPLDPLIARRVIVDYRPGCGTRVSAHFYTTDDEVDRFFSELDALRT